MISYRINNLEVLANNSPDVPVEFGDVINIIARKNFIWRLPTRREARILHKTAMICIGNFIPGEYWYKDDSDDSFVILPDKNSKTYIIFNKSNRFNAACFATSDDRKRCFLRLVRSV